jgi:phage shock protein A
VRTPRLRDRLAGLLRVNLEALLLEAPDSQQAVARHLRDLEAALDESRDGLAALAAQAYRSERALTAARAEHARWAARTDAALLAGDEAGGRAALRRQMAAEAAAKRLERERARQTAQIGELRADVETLKARAAELRERSGEQATGREGERR